MTPETWDGISSKRARERLEELMGLETGSLKAYKKEINAILNNIVVVTDQNVQAKSVRVLRSRLLRGFLRGAYNAYVRIHLVLSE